MSSSARSPGGAASGTCTLATSARSEVPRGRGRDGAPRRREVRRRAAPHAERVRDGLGDGRAGEGEGVRAAAPAALGRLEPHGDARGRGVGRGVGRGGRRGGAGAARALVRRPRARLGFCFGQWSASSEWLAGRLVSAPTGRPRTQLNSPGTRGRSTAPTDSRSSATPRPRARTPRTPRPAPRPRWPAPRRACARRPRRARGPPSRPPSAAPSRRRPPSPGPRRGGAAAPPPGARAP